MLEQLCPEDLLKNDIDSLYILSFVCHSIFSLNLYEVRIYHIIKKAYSVNIQNFFCRVTLYAFRKINIMQSSIMNPMVYIESSVISYLVSRPSRDVVIAGWQAISHDWWENHRQRFELRVSALVEEEISRVILWPPNVV